MLGPSPGPAPTPSLTLPPLRELDKILSPESEQSRKPIHHTKSSGQQPRSQSSDPHLHQHFHQQQQQHGSSLQQQSYGQQQAGNSHGYNKHDQTNRYSPTSGQDLYMSSPSAPPSATTSSTMEYPQGTHTHQHGQRQSSGGPGSSSSISDSNPSNSNQQQQPQQQGATTTTGTKESINSKSNGSANASGATSGSEQGRNSSKRAAQNRAAQRAFRQRKDLYVRELERKAELLQAAETQIMSLAARNRELEALFAAQQQGSSSSPLPSPLSQSDCIPNGMVTNAGNSSRGERDWDRERDWSRERPFEGPYDHFHSSRPAIGRHSSAQHLRQAYNSSSPPLSSGSVKHLSLGSKLPAAYYYQRTESDQEIEMQGRPQRHLHRHPSESSLNLNRTAFSSEGKDEDFQGVSRAHNYRSPVDSSRIEIESPPSSNKSPMSGSSGPFHDSPAHHYPNSPLSPTHERLPLYSSRENLRTAGNSAGPMSPSIGMHGDANYDLVKKRPSEGAVNWTGSDLYRSPQDSHPHPYHPSVKKQASFSSLSDQRRLHALKKQPSWGSISEHRHHWRNNTESPDMSSDSSRFGGVAPALPRIPPQFSQRPPPPPHRSSFEREVSPTAAAAAAAAAAASSPAPFSYSSSTPQHSQQPSWQSSEYYNHSRVPHEGSHGPSDMDIVQEGNSNGYSRQEEYEAGPYETKREERLERHEQQMVSAHGGSP